MKKIILLFTSLFLVMFLKAQYNTNYGYKAGSAGIYNTSLGFLAGDTVAGSSNTFVGYQAGMRNTSGGANTFNGFRAGYSNTTGDQNTFVGHTSGNSNTTGVNNTFYGYQSGVYNTTGSQNCFIGINAGFNNTTGNYNTNLGFYSGFNNKIGSSNVFIGSYAGYNELGSNKLYIDNSNTATPLIYGDFSTDIVNINGKLGIGMSTAPTEKLEVAGNIKATGFLGEGASVYKNHLPIFNVADDVTKFTLSIAKTAGEGGPTQAGDVCAWSNSTSDHHGFVFTLNNDNNDGLSYFKFADHANGAWVGIYNDRKMRIDGTLLIGQTTQTDSKYKLNVQGEVYATKYTGDGSGLTGIAGLSQWSTNGSNIYYNTGSVGIGTTNPVSKLDINHITLGGAQTTFTGTAANAAMALSVSSITDTKLLSGIGSASYAWMQVQNVNNTPYNLVLNPIGGNLGIGTTTPREALHVKGSIFLEGTTNAPNGSMENYFYWRGHSLIFGTEKGDYAHNVIEIKPGGASNGPLFSMLAMYTATGIGQNTQKVQIHTDGISYFNGGNVGIGTTNPDATLAVKGKIHAEEVVVDLLVPADYVFEKNYKLMPLSEVEKFVKVNKHLPGITSGKEIVKKGLNMGEMQNKMLEKVEELTLYTIEQDKVLKEQDKKLKDQEIINQQLLNEINELKSLINKK